MNTEVQAKEQIQTPDVFTVELPWGLSSGPIQINEFDMQIIDLQQHIIEGLQAKIERNSHYDIEKQRDIINAMTKEREEIILARDRAYAETDVIRNDRTKYINRNHELVAENDQLRTKVKNLADELVKVQKLYQQATDELAGVPKLIENRIKSALADHVPADDSEKYKQALSEKSQKIVELNQLNQKLEKNARSLLEKDKIQVGTIESLLEVKVHAEELATAADHKFDALQTKLEDTIAYLSIMTLENDRLTNDNMYLTLIREYDELRTIYDNGGWRVIVLCRPSMLGELANSNQIPHADFAVCLAMNERIGGGHFVYLNTNKELVFPPDMPEEFLIEEEYREGLREGFVDAHLERYGRAVDRSVARIRNVVKAAPYMAIKNSIFPESFDVTKALMDTVPKDIINTAQRSIDAINKLVPSSDAQIARINKRFGSDFPPIRDQRWQRMSASSAPNSAKSAANGKKTTRKKKRK